MSTPMSDSNTVRRAAVSSLFVLGLIATATLPPKVLLADETCLSPYMAKIVVQEDFVYVWALGVDGLGTARKSWSPST